MPRSVIFIPRLSYLFITGNIFGRLQTFTAKQLQGRDPDLAKMVIEGQGEIVYGCCPKCPERISVFLRNGEKFKNAKCAYCGAEIHGDGISAIIREGHYES